MLYGLLLTIYLFVCFLLVGIVLIQQGKGSMGLGSLGGGTQMLFGGSGGQDLFQKITWVLLSIFMGGSLLLALMKSSGAQYGFVRKTKPVKTTQRPVKNATLPIPTPQPKQ